MFRIRPHEMILQGVLEQCSHPEVTSGKTQNYPNTASRQNRRADWTKFSRRKPPAKGPDPLPFSQIIILAAKKIVLS